MTLAESVKISQALALMSSLERIKQERRFCNFTVKVDNHSFEVDKNVMVASSPYFEALFSSQMGEVNAGVVDMKEVDANAIKLSIGFIYSGEAKLDMDSIQHVLHAGNLLQIPLLLNLCFGHMQDHLSPQNCIKVMLLADTYSNEGLNKKAYEVLTSKLKDVINSETLPNLCRSDLLRCLKDCEADYKTIWNAVVSWVKGQNQVIGNSLSDIFRKYGFEKFPVKFLLETVLEEQKLNDVDFMKFVTDAIFSDVEKLEEEIGDDVDACFKLKNLLEMLGNDTDARKSILNKFFVINAANVIQKTEFLESNDCFVGKILQEGNCSEELKYEALLRWTKHVKRRRNHFSKLFKFIKLETFSHDFLKQNIKSESLVKESFECYEYLVNALLNEKKRSEMLSTSPPSNFGKGNHSSTKQTRLLRTSFSFEKKSPFSFLKQSTGTSSNSSNGSFSFLKQSTGTSSNASNGSFSFLKQSTGTSSNASNGSFSFGKPSFNFSSTKTCRKCNAPILDDRCCQVYIHDDCMDWDGWWTGQARCPQCKGNYVKYFASSGAEHTPSNSGLLAPSVHQKPFSSTSSNVKEMDSSGANQVSSPDLSKICKECTKPILDDQSRYFCCCKVHIHADCVDWNRHFWGDRARCPQCKELKTHTGQNVFG